MAGLPLRQALRLLALGFGIFVVVTAALWIGLSWPAPLRVDSAPVRGVRLGMASADVRAAFTDATSGTWSNPPGCCGETLEWTRDVAANPTRWARFEFHQGELVAIRVHSEVPPPAARRLDVTPAAVTETRAGADGTTVTTVLARECETHAMEARAILARSTSAERCDATICRMLRRAIAPYVPCVKNVASIVVVASSLGLGCGGMAVRSSDPGVDAGGADTGATAPGAAAPIPTTADLRGVWGSGPSDVWAVGAAGTIAHYDGRAWALVASGTTENLTAIAGTGPGDAWVTTDEGTVLHWDGSRWSQTWSAPDSTLLSVWANAPADVWIVGVDWSGSSLGDSSGYALHWDGASWQDADLTSSTSLWCVWASGEHDVWMVGDDTEGNGFVVRGDGTAANPFDVAEYTGPDVRGIWGHDADDVWLSPLKGSVRHWTGSSWTSAAATPDATQLFSLGGDGAKDVWAVGAGGVAFHYEGDGWIASDTATTQTLTAVWSDAPTDTWAVGAGGVALHWDGRSFTH